MGSTTDPARGRYSAVKRFLFKATLALCSAGVCLIVAEVSLRLVGKKPGYNDSFRFVEKLEVYDSFVTDGDGVFKANPAYDWPREIAINTDGFRSADFAARDPSRRKILFLGDSFTWGASAEPITESFVDLVDRAGYETFNTGIPATAPSQYVVLAERYAPRLGPDVIAVMVCLSNDFEYPSPLLPNRNRFHVTNAGWLMAQRRDGSDMTPQQAYDHYAMLRTNLAYAVAQQKTFVTKLRPIFLSTVLGTYGWNAARELRSPAQATDDDGELDPADRHVRSCLQRIEHVAAQHGARMVVYLLPEHPGNRVSADRNRGRVFDGFDVRVPDDLTVADYSKLPNNHFNNSGHRKYADFILRSLEAGPARPLAADAK